jgi:uncharacterized protein (TIGR00288 family)
MNDLYLHAPHRPAVPADAHSPHAALLIDFDNVTMGIRSNLGQELRKLLDSDIIRGKVSVQRAYADWRRYPQYIASLSEASIDLIFAPAYGSTKKNATDIRLAIDALEIVFIRPEIGTFILLSGDSDFSSLVLKLKEYGKYVIGVGIQESSSDLLVQNCDEYYSYNSLSGLTNASDMKNIVKHDPWELAAKAIRRMTERGDVMRSDRFKQVMLELDPSFSEKSIGFSKFNRFLTESASRGILDLQKAANGQYEVGIGARVNEYAAGGTASGAASAPAASRPPKREADEGRSRRRGREDRSRSPKGGSGSGRGGRSDEPGSREAGEAPPSVDEDRLRAAYDLLGSVVAEKAVRGSVRDSEVKRQMVEKDPTFDEAALGFRKFSRFLRQAHDEEVINLERTEEGNYRISSVDGDSSGAEGKRGRPEDSSGTAQSERGRSRGRRDRRERSGSPRGRDSRDKSPDETGRPTTEEGDEGGEPQAPAAEPTDESSDEAIPGSGEPRATDQPDRGSPPKQDSGPAPTRLAARKRRSHKPPSSSAAPKVVPGPVDRGDKPETEEKVERRDESATSRPTSRSMGRFRRGSRGPSGGDGKGARSGSSGGPELDKSGGESASSGTAGTDLEPDQVELVEKMARGYQGVGRRTAERLVEEFGDHVLEVIDNDPERIENVLPKGRAQAVIEGRRAELEATDD